MLCMLLSICESMGGSWHNFILTFLHSVRPHKLPINPLSFPLPLCLNLSLWPSSLSLLRPLFVDQGARRFPYPGRHTWPINTGKKLWHIKELLEKIIVYVVVKEVFRAVVISFLKQLFWNLCKFCRNTKYYNIPNILWCYFFLISPRTTIKCLLQASRMDVEEETKWL